MNAPQSEPFSEDFNVVLLGNLNPAIFHPEWFCRHGLIGPEATAEADISVVSPQVTEIDIGHIHLQCLDNRMVVRTSRSTHTEQLLDLVRGILSILPHTPLIAAGINHDAHYRVGTELQWHSIGHQLAPKTLVWDKVCTEPGMLKLTINSPRIDWDYPLDENFTVEPYGRNHAKHPAIIVRANTHFTVPSEFTDAKWHVTDVVSTFVETQWKYATTRARTVASKIFESIQS
ncbi:MAG: hypothetical protein WCK77_19750 [Verrucomicrobiota bacterium]